MRAPTLPERDYIGELTDSTRWGAFRPRDGDIVVTTPPKAGTTWTQAILALLISGDPEVDADTSMRSPWIDINVRPIEDVIERLEAQTHRRQVKSHTPLDGLPIWPDLRYIAVYRHPIDIHFSFKKHISNMSFDIMKDMFAEDPRESFHQFLEGAGFDATDLETVVTHYQTAGSRAELENLLVLHYADMTRDLSSTVRRIAEHVGISHSLELMAQLTEAARFDSMKSNSHRFTPSAGQGFWREDSNFFHSATSNKWEGVLTEDDLAAYDARISELLSAADRAWLEWGDRGQ